MIVPERELASRSDVENLVLAIPEGGYVRLRDVAEVTRAAGPVEVIRKNQVKQVIVRADTAGVDLAAAQTATRAALAEVTWPTGYAWRLGGKGQQMAEMQTVVREVLALAFFFSFLVLAVQFNSLRLPLVVFLAAPFCLAGIGYGLLLAGQPFGATVIIGVMVVLTTNVNDGGLLAAILVALYLVPVLYTLISARDRPVEVSGAAGSPAGGEADARGVTGPVRAERAAAGSSRRLKWKPDCGRHPRSEVRATPGLVRPLPT